jgi:hypothetical protein
VPDAVRVTASDVVDFYFGRVIGVTNGNVSRSAVSIQQPEACIEVGSFAAAFNSNQLSILPSELNALLHVNLTAVAYSGLANIQINLGDLAAEMGFADPDQFLSSTVTVKATAQAMANVLQRNGDAADAVVLQSIANSQPPPVGVPPQGSYNVADVVTVQQGSEEAALGTAFNVLDVLSGAAFAANGSNAISVPAFNLGVAGVLNTSVTLTAVEKPQQGCGAVGLRVTTSQVNSTITLTLTTGTTIALTYNVAQAFGDLVTPLVCEATPQLVNVSVTGSLFTSSITAKVPPLLVPITVTPPSQTVGGGTLSFALPSPDPYRVPKRSGSGSPGFTGTNVTGLPAATQPVLATAFPLIDSLIVNPTMRSLGLEVAGADVSVLDTMCRVPALKQ